MRTRAALAREDGQTAAEFALVLPLLMVALLAIIQFGIAFNDYLTLTDATRAGARKAAVSRFIGDNGTAAEGAVRTSASGMNQTSLQVNVDSTDWTQAGSEVTVTAKYPYSIDVLGWVVKAGYLTSTTKERLE